MKMIIEPSDDLVVLDGVPCRLWYGETDRGTPVAVAVHRVAVHESLDSPELDATLEPCAPPVTLLPMHADRRNQ